MAEDDEIVLEEDVVVEEAESDEIQAEEPEQVAEESEDDEVIVTIGEDSPPPEEAEPAPAWVRDLRKQYREERKRSKELEKKLAELEKGEEKKPAPTLPKKPTLEDADYDTQQYENMLAEWYEAKRRVDAEQEAIKQQEQKAQTEWQQKLDAYDQAKAKLSVRDFEDAEDAVTEQFNTVQQGMIIAGADNPALLVYALGKNPQKAAELASVQDPVKFAFALAKLETQLKVGKRSAPPPEKTVTGTGSLAGSTDRTLEKLREDAARTGDYSKVMSYKRQKRQ
jgi:hypothetical protein